MSINVKQLTDSVPLIDGGLNAVTNEAVANTGRTVKAADFVLVLGLKKGKRFTTRQCQFSCICRPGTGENAEPNLEKLINGASIIASNIATLTKGVIFGLFMKMGKYRNDEVPDSIYKGQLSNVVIDIDNVDVEVDYCGNPTSGIMPKRRVSQRLYIPFVGNDVSLQTCEQSLNKDYESGDCVVTLGVTRFVQGGDKTEVEAYRTGHISYSRYKKMDKIELIEFLNNDARLGDGDYIVSEKYNTATIAQQSFPEPPTHSIN